MSGFQAYFSITRPNDTTAYAAGDVVGSATGTTAAQTLAAIVQRNNSCMITSSQLRIDANAVISGETSYTLQLYSAAPPSALGDNAAWDLPAADRAYYLGAISLGTPADLGSTLYIETNMLNKQVVGSTNDLFAYLVTVGAYTPTAQRVYNVVLYSVGL
jgi:hypothetical protein